jgi:hypothetical protein
MAGAMGRSRAASPTTVSTLVERARASGRPAADVLGDVAVAIAEGRGVDLDTAGPGALARPAATDGAVSALLRGAPAAEVGPDLLGQVHEGLLDAGHRRRRGVFYTPPAIAAGVAGLIDWPDDDLPVVCDPAAGGGAFLLAAARLLAARGHDRAVIVERSLHGVDIDPLAAAVARTALVLWAAETGPVPAPPTIVVGDSLVQGPAVWNGSAGGAGDGFDVVVGNPPFQNQLGRTTARPVAGADAERLRQRFGPVAYRYTDSAALFLLEACRWARPGGQVALVLPQSVLVADDADALRRAVLDLGRPTKLWVAGESVFAASVRVCVPVIRCHPVPAPEPTTAAVEVRGGRAFTAVGRLPVAADRWAVEPSWGFLRSSLGGVPAVDLPAGPAGTLGEGCEATAGFRDQFYGLAPFVAEADGPTDDRPRLLTCGLIDPARSLWAERPTRFAGRRFAAPVVDIGRLRAEGPPALDAWSVQRLVPKVIVATQTRVIEAAVDEHGRWFPSVPTIALTCRPAGPATLWEAAAAVLAPAATAWAFGRHGGAALSEDALRISARQLLDLPLPTVREPWVEAAAVLRRAAAAADEAAWRADLDEFGALMGAAYGVGDEILAWWRGRLPAWRAVAS